MGKVGEVLAWLREDAEDWCEGRSALVRAPLLGYLVYAGGRHIAEDDYTDWFKGITLVFHELGHLAFSSFGHTLYILGGSLTQLFIPLAATVYLLLRQRDYFGVSVGLSWLAFSLCDLALYVGDASRENLPLVSMGTGHPEHDWATLLTEWHVLNSCERYAAVLRGVALGIWLPAMVLGVWLCIRMARSSREVPPED